LLWELLGDRYVMYGEWLYARHTIFYTHLPHYFLEFDILDTQNDHFLDMPRRQVLLASTPFIQSVRVLYAVTANTWYHRRLLRNSPESWSCLTLPKRMR
jgi:hypothetical protein